MTIIAVCSQKGGAGKTTLATNIAVALAHEGKDVLLVDSDKQASASNWALERTENQDKQPKIHCIQKHENLAPTLQDLDTRYSFVIVDAAGRDSIEMRSAMLVAQTLVIPSRPNQYDLDTLPRMVEIINAARMINPNLMAHVVITMSPSNTKRDTQDSIKFISSFSEVSLLNTIIGDRKIFRDSSSTGLGVIELPGKFESDKAGQEELKEMVKELRLWH